MNACQICAKRNRTGPHLLVRTRRSFFAKASPFDLTARECRASLMPQLLSAPEFQKIGCQHSARALPQLARCPI